MATNAKKTSETGTRAKTVTASRVNVGIPFADHREHVTIQRLLAKQFPTVQDATTDAVRAWNRRKAPEAARQAVASAEALSK